MLAISRDVSTTQPPGNRPSASALGSPAAWKVSPTGQWVDAVARAATLVQVAQDARIIAQGETAEYCFQVVAGCVRSVRLMEDGRRQVGAFLLRGDMFGLETVGGHPFATEAVVPSTLRRFRLRSIDERADCDPEFARRRWDYMTSQVRLSQERQILLGRKTAVERLASFLLEMSERLDGPGSSVIDLPMSRSDVADYLCLTIETVCRCLKQLRRHQIILTSRTRITIRDRRALGQAVPDRLH